MLRLAYHAKKGPYQKWHSRSVYIPTNSTRTRFSGMHSNTMSANDSKYVSLRSRNTLNSSDKPPVPPKEGIKLSSKPLPPAPHPLQQSTGYAEKKPLPNPPPGLNLKTTLLWIIGLLLSFLTIVALLPIITERDAMPGFHRWLRKSLSSQ
jgi:hypothetical protein